VREGKGGKDRIVPIAPALAEILDRYLEERRHAGRTCPEVFASAFRDSAVSVEALRKIFAKLQRITKLCFHPHSLRHTFATLDA
jgi:integrase